MTVVKGKRPRDPNQLAEWIVGLSTTESTHKTPAPAPSSLSAYPTPTFLRHGRYWATRMADQGKETTDAMSGRF